MGECNPCQATEAEIKEQRRKCWSPSCKKTAWLEDWCGWKWCTYHAYRNIRWGGGDIWYEIKKLKLYIHWVKP